MAFPVKINTLVLNRNTVTSTGNNLYVNSLLIGSGTYSTVIDLGSTGSALNGRVNSLSGYLGLVSGGLQAQITPLATTLNLQSTGRNLFNLVTGFSGQANINFATVGNLASTGQKAWGAANNNRNNFK